jgi:hypothetical protein
MTPTTGKLRNTLLLALVAALLTFACSGYGAPALPAAVGSWNMTIETPLGTQTPTIDVTGDASGLMVAMASPDGSVEATDVTFGEDGSLGFTVAIDAGGQQLTLVFSGMVDGDSLTGAFATDFGDMEATATRAVE